ncbi:hypothetical protein [Myxacorys almedinensis]|uniref:Uncharacterized protein n=1 Tax=Myxacorys almedinensis A TaxID=2690445 RepID=A0A8J7ZBI4_9CYAN|nr:hypothetical protein [Myxacorys almedinensis]NDJ19903.1 hypothetical protein [Myxacorys almedinensis A]
MTNLNPIINRKMFLPLSIAVLTVFAGTLKAHAEEPDAVDATSVLTNQVIRPDFNDARYSTAPTVTIASPTQFSTPETSVLQALATVPSASLAAPIPGKSVTKASGLLAQASDTTPTTPGTRNPSTIPDTVPTPGTTTPETTTPSTTPSPFNTAPGTQDTTPTTPGTRNPSTIPDTVPTPNPGGTTPGTIITPGSTQPSTTPPPTTTPVFPSTTPDTTVPDTTTPGVTSPDTTPTTPQFTPGTSPDTTTPSNNLIPPISPGRATRSGSSYVGAGVNIGVGDGDTALGSTNFEVFSKIGLTPTFSARPSIQFSDDVTILLPVTYDFSFGAGPTEALGFTAAPYVGIGAAISTGDGGDVALLLTGGVDVPLSEQFTATAAVNASVIGKAAVGIRVGVGYNFAGF